MQVLLRQEYQRNRQTDIRQKTNIEKASCLTILESHMIEEKQRACEEYKQKQKRETFCEIPRTKSKDSSHERNGNGDHGRPALTSGTTPHRIF